MADCKDTILYLHPRADFLHVYDGYDRLATKITALTGSELPSTLVSTGQAIYMGFVADASVAQFGFRIQYNASKYKLYFN